MDPTLRATVCLICFELTEKHLYVAADAPAKIFSTCNKYLHSTLNQENMKDIKLSDENQLPLCKSCFDSALELTQLSQQLTTIEKDISDLSVAFSMAVFHRRSKVYKLSQLKNSSASFQNSSTIEFNEACLPPNLFSTKTEDQNMNNYERNNDLVNNNLLTQEEFDLNTSSVKLESSDLVFENVTGNHQSLIPSDDEQIQFNEENLEKYGSQPTKIEDNLNRNVVPVSKITEVPVRNGKGSNNCTNRKNRIQLSMSDLLKSVKMPAIQLERLKIESLEVISTQTIRECPKNVIGATVSQNEEECRPSNAPCRSEGERLLECLYCEENFADESLLIEHHRSHTGTGATPYKCSFCKEYFLSETNLKMHERTHTGPFKCSYCEKRFHARTNLLAHERVHTGEKPHECSYCQKKFAFIPGLKQHERTHIHMPKKPFKCSFCEKSFPLFTTMKNHEWTHTRENPFTCPFCEKGFNAMGALKIHERIHTGKKLFKCSVCDKNFDSNRVLVMHERKHTGEKPYKCLYCEKSFGQIGSKNTNQKTHRKKQQSLICPTCNLKCGSVAHLKYHQKMHSTIQSSVLNARFAK